MLANSWELKSAYGTYAFGAPSHGVYLTESPTIGDPEITSEDSLASRADGLMFGQDFVSGGTVSFVAGVGGADEAAKRDNLDDFMAAWRHIGRSAGSISELRSMYRGVARVAYGRPRRVSGGITRVGAGMPASVTSDFQMAVPVFFSDDVSAASFSLAPGASGGFTFPLTFPMVSVGETDTSVWVETLGRLPTWPVVTVAGPALDPEVVLTGRWSLKFKMSLGFNDVLTIDTRPWNRSITVNGANAAGSIAPGSSRMTAAVLLPGVRSELSLRASTRSGARATVQWRDAYPMP